jgi:hypothetical protein
MAIEAGIVTRRISSPIGEAGATATRSRTAMPMRAITPDAMPMETRTQIRCSRGRAPCVSRAACQDPSVNDTADAMIRLRCSKSSPFAVVRE